MFTQLRNSTRSQLLLGLGTGFAFGFLLQKGGVTDYNVIINQLLLKDFTVVKVMLTAVIVGMVGVRVIIDRGLATLHLKSGSWVMNVMGGLIFGIGFALLGYCPGTAMGAAGQGSLDALAGIVGIGLGAALFAALFPALKDTIEKGSFGALALPELLKAGPWFVIAHLGVVLVVILILLEIAGL